MSKFEQKDQSGALFKNERKESENQPDYTGNGKVNGKEVSISAWLKTSKDGSKKFLSLAFSEPYRKDAVKIAGDGDAPRGRDKSAFDDVEDLPF